MSTNFYRSLAAFALMSSIFLSFPIVRGQDKPAVEDKKQLEARAKQIAEEAKALEAKGQLKEAEEKYVAAEAIISTREGLGGLERVRRDKIKKTQSLLTESHGLYDAGKTQEAISKLEEASGLEPSNASVRYNLAVSYAKVGDRPKAISELDQCLQILPDGDKNRGQLEQMKSSLVTGENPSQVSPELKLKIDNFNNSAAAESKASIGLTDAEASKPPAQDAKSAPPTCPQLKELEPSLPKSPALYFNLAKCAEEDGRQDDALRYLNQYLATAPSALDADDVRLRVATDTSLTQLSGPSGEQVRKLYATAVREINIRKYDRAAENLLKAEQLMPDYPTTKWRLALYYEATGDISKAHDYYSSYQALEPSDEGKKEAATHLENLEKERAGYDAAIREARTILNPLLLRSLGLDEEAASGKRNVSTANGMSYGYVQEKLDEARKKLDVAAGIFPLGPEVNGLMAFTYMQGNNPAAAMRCYDIVASQHVPIAFYATAFPSHDRKAVKEVKVELVQDKVRLIYLSTYNAKTKAYERPAQPAGTDALGNFGTAKPEDVVKDVESISWKTADIKGIETKNNYVTLNLGNDEMNISPLNIGSQTPFQGIPARKFGNNYSRLFLRYMGYDNTKLGAEHMTGGEKFALGMTFAAAGMGGYAAFAGSSAMMATQLMFSMYALNSAMSTLRRSRADQRQLLDGNDFKIIPSQSFDLAFREKFQ